MNLIEQAPAPRATTPRPTHKGYSRLNGRYQIVSLIGRGGMASVYEARDEFLGRDVAVKLFEAPASGIQNVESQERELQILARLNHHSLVSLLDAGVHERTDPTLSRMFLVMELVRGSTLKRLIASKRLTGRDVAHIGIDLADGLKYIHNNGIVHRDIKPANVLMVEYTGVDDERPRAKLADFGIALIADAAAVPLASQTTTGTAAYLSPEQALGEKVGPPSDIYALGLVLLESFTRTIAFPGGVIESAVARLSRDPAIPSTLPEGWASLLAAMTSRHPENRPAIVDVITSLKLLARHSSSRHQAAESASLPDPETQRMAAVDRYEVLDSPSDGAFDRITGLAARIFDVPISIISIVDRDRIWFKSHLGVDVEEVGRDAGLCASAVLHGEPWVVTDARTDVRAMANPLVAGELGIQFYAGVPLRTSDGHNLGTLCVLDYKPRPITEAETRNLEDLAAMVMSELELRLATKRALR
jgi:serine/threonine protein kinase